MEEYICPELNWPAEENFIIFVFILLIYVFMYMKETAKKSKVHKDI